MHRNKPSLSPPVNQQHQHQQWSEGEARRTPHENGESNGSRALRPTRGQAELDEVVDEEEGAGWGGEQEQGSATSSSRRLRREEPRSVEEAGPLRVLYQGHDMLIIDKVRFGM